MPLEPGQNGRTSMVMSSERLHQDRGTEELRLRVNSYIYSFPEKICYGNPPSSLQSCSCKRCTLCAARRNPTVVNNLLISLATYYCNRSTATLMYIVTRIHRTVRNDANQFQLRFYRAIEKHYSSIKIPALALLRPSILQNQRTSSTNRLKTFDLTKIFTVSVYKVIGTRVETFNYKCHLYGVCSSFSNESSAQPTALSV